MSETSSKCPNSLSIKPCICTDGSITCMGKDFVDLKHIFMNLGKILTKNEKHFKSFELNNTAINELKENTFGEITFDYIFINNCSNLTTIHKNAFTTTNLVTIYLSIYNYNNLIQTEENNIFEVLSKFINIETIYLFNNNIKEIPSNAFKPINGIQNKLQDLCIYDKSLIKLGKKAF